MKKILFLLLPLSFFLVNCGSFGNEAPHIRDEVLLKNFQENKADFDLLAQMAEQDSNMVRIADDFTWTNESATYPRPESELGISNERWEEYKKIFRKIKLDNGIRNYQSDQGVVYDTKAEKNISVSSGYQFKQVFLYASRQGLVTGGSSKGYAYLKEKPEIVVDSLNDFQFEKSEERRLVAYKQITENWYLYYEVSS